MMKNIFNTPVRTTITIAITVLFVYLSIIKYFTSTDVLVVVTMVMSYYFANKSTMDNPGNPPPATT
jgi:hypothetical protein